MLQRMKEFFLAEDGAVTVDWVVLTACVVGLAGAVVVSIQAGTESVGTGVENSLTSVAPTTGF